MSTEFNYKRAWEQYVAPRFKRLPTVVKTALKATEDEVDHIHQMGASHTVTGASDSLKALFEAIPVKALAKASQVIYYYGHLSPKKTAQKGGLYWKFQILADTSLIKRGAYGPDSPMSIEKRTMDSALKNFYDHEDGTEYDNNEVPVYIRKHAPNIGEGVLEISSVRYVNHIPDIFCITNKHMQLSQGPYLDPNVAPCGHCGQPYSAHTYERAMLLKVIREDKKAINNALLKLKEFCAKHNIKIDLFGFIKG